MSKPLTGVRVMSLESRRGKEMQTLLEKRGATAIPAPSMQEVPLSGQREAQKFARELPTDPPAVMLLLTGVGTRLVMQVLEQEWGRERTRQLLSPICLFSRGPKPVLALKEFELTPTATAPEPNTWRELLGTVDRWGPISNLKVCVQEYGSPNPELLEALRQRRAQVRALPVYGWTLPDDREPLRNAVRQILAGQVDAALFTSAQQIEHLLLVADELGERADVVRQLDQRIVIASIGPVTSEALSRHGVRTDAHPEHSKMGQLVSHLAEHWQPLKANKTSGR